MTEQEISETDDIEEFNQLCNDLEDIVIHNVNPARQASNIDYAYFNSVINPIAEKITNIDHKLTQTVELLQRLIAVIPNHIIPSDVKLQTDALAGNTQTTPHDHGLPLPPSAPIGYQPVIPKTIFLVQPSMNLEKVAELHQYDDPHIKRAITKETVVIGDNSSKISEVNRTWRFPSDTEQGKFRIITKGPNKRQFGTGEDQLTEDIVNELDIKSISLLTQSLNTKRKRVNDESGVMPQFLESNFQLLRSARNSVKTPKVKQTPPTLASVANFQPVTPVNIPVQQIPPAIPQIQYQQEEDDEEGDEEQEEQPDTLTDFDYYKKTNYKPIITVDNKIDYPMNYRGAGSLTKGYQRIIDPKNYTDNAIQFLYRNCGNALKADQSAKNYLASPAQRETCVYNLDISRKALNDRGLKVPTPWNPKQGYKPKAPTGKKVSAPAQPAINELDFQQYQEWLKFKQFQQNK